MAGAADIALFRKGLDSLRADGLKDIADANAEMTKPLVEAIRTIGQTGNDQADLRALRDRLPGLLDQMDDAPVAAWAEELLLQTFALAHTAAVPEGIEDLEREDADRQDSLADTLKAG